MEPVVWGVLGASNFARIRTIPAMLDSQNTRVAAIASRTLARAQAQASEFGVPGAHGSYEALLEDPEIEAVYIPLPNHLHVEWSIKAAEAGKHVLCEKPIAMTAEEAATLIPIRDRTGRRIMEAFMVRTHPRWLDVCERVRAGAIGDVRAIQTFVGYTNLDPENIRNQSDIGGGGLMDIGCYAITTARLVLNREPERAIALVDHDPAFGTDRLASVILDFGGGVQATFMSGTQVQLHQHATIVGTTGTLEVPHLITAPPDRPSEIYWRRGSPLESVQRDVIQYPPINQYVEQFARFSACIRSGEPQAIPLEDAVANMRVLDAIFASAESGRWERV